MRVVVLALSFFALSLTACGTKPRCRTDTCTGCCTMDDQCVAGTTTPPFDPPPTTEESP